MYRIWIIVILCLLRSASLMAIGVPKVTFARKNFCDTIKISYKHGHIMMPVVINDHTYQFMFDTGANLCLFSGSIREDFIKQRKGSIEDLDFDNKTRRDEHGIMRDVRIGRNVYSNLGYVVGNMGVPLYFDGVFGALALMRNGVSMKIDVRKGILILTDRKGMFAAERGLDISCDYLFRFHFTMSHGCRGKMFLDTGANRFMTIGKSEYFDKSLEGIDSIGFRQQILWTDSGSVSRNIHGLEQSGELVYMKLDEVRVGDAVFCDVPVRVKDGATVMGCRMLEYGSMIIDARKGDMMFQPYEKGNYIHIKERMEDVSYGNEGGNVVVSMINPNSDAFRQGLRKGCRLIEYDKLQIKGYNDYLLARKVTAREKTFTARFLDDEGKIIEIIFKR